MNKNGEKTKLLAVIAVFAMVLCAMAAVMPAADAADGNVAKIGEDPYTSLDAAIAAAKTTADEDAPVTIELLNAATIATAADLSNIIIDCKAFGITATANVTNGTIKGTQNESGSNILLGIGADKLTVSNVDFEVAPYAAGNTSMPYAINTAQYNATISGCTFTGAQLFGAIHTNSPSKDVKVSVSGCTLGNGMIIYKGCTMEISDSTVNMNYVDINDNGQGGKVSTENLTIVKSTVEKTIIGWDASTVPEDKKYGGSTELAVDKDMSLGDVSTGTANSEAKASITSKNGAIPTYDSLADGIEIKDEAGNKMYSGIINDYMEFDSDIVFGDVTVGAGATVILKGDVKVQGDFRLYGNVKTGGGVDSVVITVEKEGKFLAYSGATIADNVYLDGDGEIDISNAMYTMRLGDDIVSNNTYTQSQTVLIIDSLTIKSGYTLTVLGELIIEDGVTLTIEDGAELIVGSARVQGDNASYNAIAIGVTVDGSIIVENGGKLTIANAYDVTVNGSIESDGTFTVNSDVTVNGSVFIDDSAPENGTPSKIVLAAGNGFTVESTGTLTITGEMAIDTISNKGTIVLDGATMSDAVKIQMAADGATVDIVSVTNTAAESKELRIEDVGLVFNKNVDPVTKNVNDNAVSIAVPSGCAVEGLTIAEGITSERDGDITKYTNIMYISGSITVNDELIDPEPSSPVSMNVVVAGAGSNNGGIVVAADKTLEIGENVKFNVSRGTMTVDGTVDATADGAVITSNGSIDVNGMITAKTKIESGINAFHYTTGTGSNKVENYTTLATSLTNGATSIDYLGSVEVLETLTIPAGTTLMAQAGAKLTIGDEDNRDVVLTVAADGAIRNGNGGITVKATLVFENNKDGNRNNGNIVSDVIINEGESRTYTNIYTALEAETGTITLNSGNVYLDKDIEVKSGVTLKVPSDCNLYLLDEVTMTINGTVENEGTIGNVDEIPAAGASPVVDADGFLPTDEDAAAIVVNGAFKDIDSISYTTYYIPGAYYQIVNTDGSWYWVTPVATAAGYAAIVENGVIDIYGTNAVGDVDFTATEDAPVTITVKNGADVTISSISLTYATLRFDNASNAEFDGTVDSADGSIVVVNANGFTVEGTADEDGSYLYLSGTPAMADDEGAKASLTVASGVVTVDGVKLDISKVAFTIADDASVIVTGTNGEIEGSAMTVTGTLTATDNGLVDIDTVTVRGTLTIAEKDDAAKTAAGKADITNMYIGITEKDNVYSGSSAATVNAPGAITQLTLAVVSAESTVSEKLTEKMVSTEFYVEDALWVTAYVPDGATAEKIADVKAGDLTDCHFNYWADSNGKKIEATTTGATIGGTNFEKVYADLEYDIYTINIRADQNALSSISIDGNLMQFGMIAEKGADGKNTGSFYYGYTIVVAAGSHTVQYQLANGYSGNGVLSVLSGNTTVSGLTFSTSGTGDSNENLTLQLSGFEKSGYVPDSPDTGDSTESDSGMTITDYLLIVLVVLIVVMAIIVAMRLMRS